MPLPLLSSPALESMQIPSSSDSPRVSLNGNSSAVHLVRASPSVPKVKRSFFFSFLFPFLQFLWLLYQHQPTRSLALSSLPRPSHLQAICLITLRSRPPRLDLAV
ncbi:hypothetical protein IE53DRAFT_277599 [Violaceomyces palustris]|uniref:Uncharacterized protein n=1 Tax=Violaceomyces palustris TaxID=1673888 RepID=A0ACD0NMJ5_9BASI|nr:hypothetical protein IE53DRAFT_277599 [Violaceomyces palustris]